MLNSENLVIFAVSGQPLAKYIHSFLKSFSIVHSVAQIHRVRCSGPKKRNWKKEDKKDKQYRRQITTQKGGSGVDLNPPLLTFNL